MWAGGNLWTRLTQRRIKRALDDSKGVHHRLLERPSREDVLHGFRLILGREPEDESAIRAHMLFPTVADLRQALLLSEEFKGKYLVLDSGAADHPSLSMHREALVFIHLQKTGGTSLRAMLEGQYAAHRRCPIHDDRLHFLSMAELGRYDFFAGHFDRSVLQLIPRETIRTIALFREPCDRLISLYRFLRAHPARDEFLDNPLVRLANESTAEEFFEHPTTRASTAVYNHYLIALGASFCWFDRNRAMLSPSDLAAAQSRAECQIRALTGLGITEHFDRSVALICDSMNIQSIPVRRALHVTDNLRDLDARFQSVDPVPITPRLHAALEELVHYDVELYRCAVKEFERRCAQSAGI